MELFPLSLDSNERPTAVWGTLCFKVCHNTHIKSKPVELEEEISWPFLKTWSVCSETENCRGAVRVGWEVRLTYLNFSLWCLILLSVEGKPNSFHGGTVNLEKYSLGSVRLCSWQAFQAIWTVRLPFHLTPQRNLNAVMQLCHLVSLENLGEMQQILNCDITRDGKADL